MTSARVSLYGSQKGPRRQLCDTSAQWSRPTTLVGHNRGMGEMRERPWREWRFRGVVAIVLGVVFAAFGVLAEKPALWQAAAVAILCGLLCLVVALVRWASDRRRSARPEAGE